MEEARKTETGGYFLDNSSVQIKHYKAMEEDQNHRYWEKCRKVEWRAEETRYFRFLPGVGNE